LAPAASAFYFSGFNSTTMIMMNDSG